VYIFIEDMVDINLHGKLGQQFESSWNLDVENVAEILKALDVQVPGFRKYLVENEVKGARYCVAIDGETLKTDEGFFCNIPQKAKSVDFLPVPAGGGPALPFLAELFKMIAVALVVSFIVNKIFEPPDPEELKESDSYLFAGPVNVESQGIPVPIAYGTLLIGGKVISAMNRYANAPTVYTGPWMDHEPDISRFQEWENNLLRNNPFATQGIYFEGVDPFVPEGWDMISNSFVSSTFATQRAAQLGYVDPEKMAGG
jgi:predicted phage tail protein